MVSADFSVNANHALLQDLLDLSVVESVLQTITEEKVQRETFTELVRSTARAYSKDSSKLVKHPVMGSGKALQMLLRSASHFCTSS